MNHINIEYDRLSSCIHTSKVSYGKLNTVWKKTLPHTGTTDGMHIQIYTYRMHIST